MMIKRFKFTRRRKLLAAIIICVALITGSTMLWQTGKVAEAAILDPHPGLVGWWRFDEGNGTVAEDSSGYGNHGTIYGDNWVNGKYGQALSFDGIDDYVKVEDDAALNSANFSVVFWFRLSSQHHGAGYFILQKGRWSATPSGSGWAIYHYPQDSKGILFMVSSADQHLSYAFDADLDVWYHFAMTFNNTINAFKVYRNGQNVYSSTLTGAYLTPEDYPLHMMRCINGSIDEVRVYNRALSLDEIQENFQKGPDFSRRLLAKVPKGTTEFIATLSWQGVGSINVTIESPSEIYTEDMIPMYQRASYSSSSGDMLNIKRLSVSVAALSCDEDWYIVLEFDDLDDYRITVEIQR